MKKFLLTTLIALFGLAGANAQMEAGAHLGVPTGDSDGFSFNAGGTFAYYFPVVAGLKVGGSIGIDHFFGKEYDWGNYEIDGEDATFIPIAAAAKYNFPGKFFVGLDLGYAIGVSDGAGDGGFMFKPRAGLSLPMIDIYGFYKGISYSFDYDYGFGYSSYDWTLGSVGVGAAFKF